MTVEISPYQKHLNLVLLVLTVFLCAACGSKLIRGAAPLVRMNELSHQDNTIALQLSIRNLNGVSLDVEDIDLGLTIDDEKIFAYKGPVNTNISANGTEILSVEATESGTGKELLDSLQNGNVNSLPYVLKGSVASKDDGTLRFEHEGHIYPLPGRPGHFR